MENSTLSLLGDVTSNEENSTSSAPHAEKLIMHRNQYNLPLTIRKAGPPGSLLIKRSPKPRRRIKQPRPVYGPPKHNNLADPFSNFHNVNPFDQTSHTHTHSHVFEEQIEKLSMKDFEKFKHEFDTDLGIQTLPVNHYDADPVHLDFKKPKMKYKPKKKRVHTSVSIGKPVETYRVHGKPTENYKLLEEFVEEQFNQQLNKQIQLDAGISRDPFKPSRYIGTLDTSQEEDEELFPPFHQPSKYSFADQPQHKYPKYSPSQDGDTDSHQSYKNTKYSHDDTDSDDFDTGKYSFADQQSPQQQPDIYQNSHNFGSGYFAEPPPSTPAHYNIPLQSTPDYHLEDLVSKHTYLPPQSTGGVDFPINNKEPPYGYDYPKSSYEVPLYNPNSKMAEVEKQAEMHFYPPDFHDAYQNEAPFRPVEDQPSSLDKGSGSNKIEVTLKRFPQSPVVVNPTDLPKPKYHKAPKVKTTTTENYPPSFTATPPTTRKRRYRERTTPSTTTKRHNLDTDELRKAFESSTRSYYNRKHSSDESEYGQESSNTNHFALPSNSQEAKDQPNSWEPVKVRGGNGSSRRSVLNKRINLAPTGDNRELKKLQDEFKDIEIISIEKANTHDYYAGTIGPDFEESVFKLPGLKGRKDLHTVSAGIQVGDNSPTKRRGQVFDDNIASSDESTEDNDRSDSLPTNHKL